jgi:glycosyltransferase involved in cell wall biosynthesis
MTSDPHAGPLISVLVPTFNRLDLLREAVASVLAQTHRQWELVLVDDGSSDGTGEILQRIHEAAPAAVTILRQSRNLGKAEAVRAGILAGLGQRAALVGFFDADLATPLGAVDDFLAVLRDRPAVEFVLGSRVLLLGRDIKRKATRHYFGRVFATAVSNALDLPVYDTQCGAKILRANAATATLFETPFRSAWIFDVELIARYLRLPVAAGEPARRDRLYELVLQKWHDRPGSKLRWYDFVSAAVEVGYIWRERVAYRQPEGRGRSTRGQVPHVPVTIQPPHEAGSTKEST